MITPIADWLTLDDTGLQMPWYTRPCLEWLDTLDIKGKLIFEYGMGNSTKWYASRGAEVFGVDSNPEWGTFANQFGQVFVTENQQEYLYEIYKGYNLNTDLGTIDLAIIDGLYRDDCTEHALKCLKPGGILIIDNWEQSSVEPNDWTKTKELIKNLKQTVYKEPEHLDWKTLVIQL